MLVPCSSQGVFSGRSQYIAEEYLLKKYKENKFPVSIIRPGNVYGPGATTWVLRPLQSIQKNRISLINHGNGLFLHTYIDNLLDAIISAVNKKNIFGLTFNITDGDSSTTWKDYFNFISKIAGKPNIEKNMSRKSALLISKIMLILNNLIGIKPLLTPLSVQILTNNKKISIKKARELLSYHPKINYTEGLNRIYCWLKKEKLI